MKPTILQLDKLASIKTVSHRLSLLVFTAAFIVACGGGGGGGESPAGTSTGASTVALTTADPSAAVSVYSAPARATPLVAPALTGDVATDALAWMNYRRTQLGLAPMVRNPLLDKAALAHANYIALNDSYGREGHSETSGNAGFTGIGPVARLGAVGYTIDRYLNENLNQSSYKYGPIQTDGLIDAPYHRSTQFANYADVGAGASFSADVTRPSGGFYTYAANFGSVAASWGPSANQVLVYPAQGQTDAPTSWLALENPNPLPDLAGRLVGYPISVHTQLGGRLALSRFSFTDSLGAAVAGRLITTIPVSGATLSNFAFWIPLQPLSPGARYTAATAGFLNDSPLNLTWSFTTSPQVSLTATFSANTLAATPGATLDITLTGGSGHRLELFGDQSGFLSFVGQIPGSPTFATADYVSPTKVTLTRTSTPCNPIVFASCSVDIFGTDSSGTVVPIRIPVR